MLGLKEENPSMGQVRLSKGFGRINVQIRSYREISKDNQSNFPRPASFPGLVCFDFLVSLFDFI